MNAAPFAIEQAHYLIVDLEATCCDRGTIPRAQNEIIEIGAVMLCAASLERVGEFGCFVRPVRHPHLTTFCTNLTSITQEQVNEAPLYPEAMQAFRDWMYPFGSFMFSSWGDYDRKQFEWDCEFHGVSWPFPSGHLNLKAAFAMTTGRKKMGMTQALEHLGLPLEGTHHRGIDDARNIARIVQEVLRQA